MTVTVTMLVAKVSGFRVKACPVLDTGPGMTGWEQEGHIKSESCMCSRRAEGAGNAISDAGEAR